MQEKDAAHGKILELFYLDAIKTTISMEISTQKWTKIRIIFFQNKSTFSGFQKGAGEASSTTSSHSSYVSVSVAEYPYISLKMLE